VINFIIVINHLTFNTFQRYNFSSRNTRVQSQPVNATIYSYKRSKSVYLYFPLLFIQDNVVLFHEHSRRPMIIWVCTLQLFCRQSNLTSSQTWGYKYGSSQT